MKPNKLYMICLGMLVLVLAACSKGQSDFLYKEDILPVSVRGYNGSSEKLVVKLDTFSLELSANASFEANTAYIFPGEINSVKLTVTEKSTGKLVLEKELKKEDGKATVSFFYINGHVGDLPVKPGIEEGKLKLIYQFQPTATNYDQPVDIALGIYYLTPQVFEEFARLKGLKPYTFSEPITLPTFSTTGQTYNGVPTAATFVARIFKAGTNDPYITGTGYTWNATSSTAPKPAASVATSKLYIFTESPSGSTMRFSTLLEQ